MKKKGLVILIFFVFSATVFAQGSATDSILRYWLRPQIVNNNLPVTNTFYFWTSSNELDSCLEQKRLLRTSVSDRFHEEMYVEELLKFGRKNNSPIVNHLLSGDRQRIREGWPCYWASMGAFIGDSTHNQLVQVILMDSSLIISFFPDERKSKMWKVHDLKGNELTMEQAMLRKRHIAAVLMCNDEKVRFPGPRRTVYHNHYRSFILCNEDMIKSWHHNVPGLQAKVLKDFDYLVLLNAWLEDYNNQAQQGKKGKVCYAAWTMSVSEMRISDLVFATRNGAGFLGEGVDQVYMMNTIEQLRTWFRKQKNPCERFPGKKPASIPPGN